RRVPAVGLQGSTLAAPSSASGGSDAPGGARKDDRGGRGGDAGRGRGPAVRGRGEAPGRDPRPPTRAPSGDRRRSSADRLTPGYAGQLPRDLETEVVRVALERQSIEKRDFPISGRGYDPEAVDSHLSALAEEVEELKRSARRRNETLASSASEHVR